MFAGVVAPLITVVAFKHRSVILAFLTGPAWVAFVCMLEGWNEGTAGPPFLTLSFAAVHATIIGVPIGVGLALVIVLLARYSD